MSSGVKRTETLTVHTPLLVDPALYPRPLPNRTHYNHEPRAANGHRHEYDNRTLLCVRCRKLAPINIWRLDRYNAGARRMQKMALAEHLEASYPAVLPLPEDADV